MARWAPERADVIAEYAREILEVNPRGRLVVGLDGIESVAQGESPSAREAFAADLAAAVRATGVPAVAVPLGAASPLPADPERVPDEAAFRRDVLTPFRRGELPGAEADRAVLVVSGAFLHLGDLAGVWHTSAWLQLPRQEARDRDAARLPGADHAAWGALVDAAFRRLDARKRTKATFDLTDPAHPSRRFEDAC